MIYVAYDAYKSCFIPIKDWAAERVIKTDSIISGNVINYQDLSKVVNMPDGKVYILIEQSELEAKLNEKKNIPSD